MADLEENARRKAQGKKEIALSPIAIEVVRRIDALFEIERSINGKAPKGARRSDRTLSRPLVDDLQVYMREQRAKLSRGHDLAKAMQLHAEALGAFTLFLDDGRVCLSNNAAESAAARHRFGRKVVAVLRIRSRRPARRGHVQPDRHGQDERRRSAGLARRRPRSHRRAIRLTGSTSCCRGIGIGRARRPVRRPDHGRDQLRLHDQPCR